MVTTRLAEKLNLRGPKESTTIGTVNGSCKPQMTMKVAFQVAATEGNAVFDIMDAFVISSLILSKRAISLKKLVEDWPHLAAIPLIPSATEEVGILIGLDHPALHEISDQCFDPLNQRAPRAIRTPFGCCIIGPISSYSKNQESIFNSFALTIQDSQPDQQLDLLVKKFLQSDVFGVKPDAKPPIGREESRALDILSKTVRHVGDRFEAGLLWRFDEPRLPNNRKIALRRLISLERRFTAEPPLQLTLKSWMTTSSKATQENSHPSKLALNLSAAPGTSRITPSSIPTNPENAELYSMVLSHIWDIPLTQSC